MPGCVFLGFFKPSLIDTHGEFCLLCHPILLGHGDLSAVSILHHLYGLRPGAPTARGIRNPGMIRSSPPDLTACIRKKRASQPRKLASNRVANPITPKPSSASANAVTTHTIAIARLCGRPTAVPAWATNPDPTATTTSTATNSTSDVSARSINLAIAPGAPVASAI